MITAEHYAALFQTMAYNPHPAMLARWCKLVDGTFEAIKSIGFIGSDYLKRFIVLVPASVTFWHNSSSVGIC